MAKVVKNAQEENQVEFLSQLAYFVNRHAFKIDVELVHVGSEASLRQVLVVGVQTEHPRGAAALHLHRIKSGVATDIEHRFTREVVRNGLCKAAPLDFGIVSQEMRWRGAHSV